MSFGPFLVDSCGLSWSCRSQLVFSGMKMKMTLLLLGLTCCVCAGAFVVNVTQTSCQEEEGGNVTLEWTFTTQDISSLKSINVLCSVLTPQSVSTLFHLHEGVEVPESQAEPFAGRVQFDKDVLREGRVRLHVSRLRTEDSGLYVCEVFNGIAADHKTCRLNVTAVRDQPEPEKPDPLSLPGRGRTGLYGGLGLMAAVVSLGWLITSCSSRRRRLSKSVVGGLSSSGSEEPV